jgi:hypothetical protein
LGFSPAVCCASSWDFPQLFAARHLGIFLSWIFPVDHRSIYRRSLAANKQESGSWISQLVHLAGTARDQVLQLQSILYITGFGKGKSTRRTKRTCKKTAHRTTRT